MYKGLLEAQVTYYEIVFVLSEAHMHTHIHTSHIVTLIDTLTA